MFYLSIHNPRRLREGYIAVTTKACTCPSDEREARFLVGSVIRWLPSLDRV
jgi:hypothetical protein